MKLSGFIDYENGKSFKSVLVNPDVSVLVNPNSKFTLTLEQDIERSRLSYVILIKLKLIYTMPCNSIRYHKVYRYHI